MIIDARGLPCPQPIMATKKALDALTQTTDIDIYLDDDIAKCNVEAYLGEMGIACAHKEDNNTHILSFRYSCGGDTTVAAPEAPEECIIPAAKLKTKEGYVVVVKSLSMGDGSRELGEMLMKTFMSTLVESSHLPTHVIFYNEGAKCAVNGSDFAASIAKLEEKGVKMVVCGVCADFYEIKEQIKKEYIGNMFKIVELVTSASKVVYPQ